MTTWCIPTYRRPDALATLTLPLLLARGVAPVDIEVWLSDPQEADAYRAALAGRGLPVVPLCDGLRTLKANRFAAMQAHRVGAQLVFVDDDVRDVLQLRADGKLHPAPDLPEVAARGFRECAHLGVRLWGISPVANAYFMRAGAKAGLLFAVGYLYGLVNDQGAVAATQLDEKEDYERTLRCWARDGAVVRLADVAARSVVYKGGGGMVDGRTVEAQQLAVHQLETWWPKNVRRNTRRKGPYPEITLHAPRARPA